MSTIDRTRAESDSLSMMKAKNDSMIENKNYQKVLELLANLEKKMNNRFLEAHHEMASSIVNAFDVGAFKREQDESFNAVI